jgi:adenosylhomocysteine nucleosidase
MIAIIAALPREVAALVRGHAPDPVWKAQGISLYRLPKSIVVAAGMGPERATLAVEAAFAEAPIALLVSAGLAGSCSQQLLPGTVAEAHTVIDVRSGERFSSEASGGLTLATTTTIASTTEKARLHATYNAAMVDMEAATVARLAAAHNIPFRAIKAISDAHTFELENLAQFAGPRGEFRTAAFALHTALRPQTWSKAIELGKGSKQALAGLTEALRRLAS